MDHPPGTTIDRVHVGIVTAMPLEAAAIVGRLRDALVVRAGGRRLCVGRLGGVSVAVLATGVGGDAAVQGMRVLIAGHRPARIVAAGVCGGLDPALVRGGIVVPDRVGLWGSAPAGTALPTTSSTATIDTLPIDTLPAGQEASSGPGVARGLLVTSEAVVATAAAKRDLRVATGAVAVDMESWWIVAEARRIGMPVQVVRGVCDTSTETVPADIASLTSAGSTARLAGAAVRLLWHRPAAAMEMVELREHAHVAADAVAVHLESMLGR